MQVNRTNVDNIFENRSRIVKKIKTKDYCEWLQTPENILVEARFPNKYDDHD